MFWHEYKCIEYKSFFFAGGVDAASQLFSPRIIRKQRLATVARERQLMKVPRDVEVLDLLSMRLPRTHTPTV